MNATLEKHLHKAFTVTAVSYGKVNFDPDLESLKNLEKFAGTLSRVAKAMRLELFEEVETNEGLDS